MQFAVFQRKEGLHSPLGEERGQKFKHAFCHRAAYSRICVKAELTFDPSLLLMESYLHVSEKPQIANRIGITSLEPSLNNKLLLHHQLKGK
ncbi:MAG: hypothetical protein OXB86_06940 [Bdellovibrionales bacterium]|nr:hypothetical protein [Bdellovibrionales bacterium]